MPHSRLIALSIFLFLSLGFGLGSPAATIQAQDTGGNLLRDPSFQNPAVWKTVVFDEGSGSRFSVAPDWEGWYSTSPRTQPWMNQVPNGYPHNETGAAFTRSGGRSQEISRGGATFTAAVYQTVTVPENANLSGGAWVRMNLDLNANPNARARVGIDPNGGNTPGASGIVWSNWATNSVNSFTELNVNATANGTRVTIWLYATQSFPSNPNGVYWDDAFLRVGGPGGSAPGNGSGGNGAPAATQPPPPPTAPPSASFVSPQCDPGETPCIHTVSSGDTLDAIAVAYGVPRSRIVELNNMTEIRFLQIGQRLTIRPASAASDDDDADDEEEADTPAQVAQAPTSQPDDDDADDEDEEEPTPTVTPTPTPAPTNTPAPPAPVAMADTDDDMASAGIAAAVCIILYEDVNMNRIQEDGDGPLEGGTVSLRQGGEDVESYATDGSPDPYCFEDLEPGDYVAAASPPPGFGLTTPDQLRLRLQAGTTLNVSFGAAEGVQVAAPPPADAGDLIEEEAASELEAEPEDENPFMQNLGLIVFGLAALTLVGGAGLTLLIRRS